MNVPKGTASAWWHMSHAVVALLDRANTLAWRNAYRVADRTGRLDRGGPRGSIHIFESALLARLALIHKARAERAENERAEQLEVAENLARETVHLRRDLALARDVIQGIHAASNGHVPGCFACERAKGRDGVVCADARAANPEGSDKP